jgi:tryptophanyl-tRNA synthetase
MILKISDYIYKCAATLIACGIDPSRTILYQQSQVPYHGQLSWIFTCKVTMPQLGRMNQFKYKSDGLAETPLGLYSYPILQTADILLYKATHVPVGEDQLQHLELSRDIAHKFNNFYKIDYFPAPIAIESE